MKDSSTNEPETQRVDLSFDDITNAQDVEIKPVYVPEWGGTVYLRTMSGSERDAFEADVLKRKGKRFEPDMHNYRANFVSRVLCDSKGNLLCKTREQREALGRKSVAVVERLANMAREMNGMLEIEDEDSLGN